LADLARILDPASLDAAPGRRGRMRVSVPSAWLEEGAELELVAPRVLPCARCDGGGCDECRRSGALELSRDAALRTVRVRLPEDAPPGLALRLLDPFGPGGGVEQLIVEIREDAAPSAGCTRVDPPRRSHARRSAGAGGDPWARAAMMALVIAGLLAVLLGATRP
jgi:hypothetical protein